MFSEESVVMSSRSQHVVDRIVYELAVGIRHAYRSAQSALETKTPSYVQRASAAWHPSLLAWRVAAE